MLWWSSSNHNFLINKSTIHLCIRIHILTYNDTHNTLQRWRCLININCYGPPNLFETRLMRMLQDVWPSPERCPCAHRGLALDLPLTAQLAKLYFLTWSYPLPERHAASLLWCQEQTTFLSHHHTSYLVLRCFWFPSCDRTDPDSAYLGWGVEVRSELYTAVVEIWAEMSLHSL